jgi:hypothetical protein
MDIPGDGDSLLFVFTVCLIKYTVDTQDFAKALQQN